MDVIASARVTQAAAACCDGKVLSLALRLREIEAADCKPVAFANELGCAESRFLELWCAAR